MLRGKKLNESELQEIEKFIFFNPCNDESWEKLKNILCKVKFDRRRDNYYLDCDHLNYLTTLYHLSKKKQGKNENKFYPYIKKCVEKIITPSSFKNDDMEYRSLTHDKNFNHATQILQLCLAMILKRQDYGFAIEIFSRPILQKQILPLFQPITLDGKKDNLLHYFLTHVNQVNWLLNQAYADNTQSHYQNKLKIPQDILNRIQSKAGTCGMLLLFLYLQYDLTTLKYHLTRLICKLQYGLTSYNDYYQEGLIKNIFSSTLYAYCQWRRLIIMGVFADNMTIQDQDRKIKAMLTNCLHSILGHPKISADCNVDFIIKNIKNFCDETGYIPVITKEIINEIAAEFQADENLKILYYHTQKCLNTLCFNFSNVMRDKNGEPLKKIRKVVIVDEEKSLTFANSEVLSEYLKKINESKELLLSKKLRKICNILEQAVNKIKSLPEHMAAFLFFSNSNDITIYESSETAEKIQQLLKSLICEIKEIYKFNVNKPKNALNKHIKHQVDYIYLLHTNLLFKGEHIKLRGINDIVAILEEYEKILPTVAVRAEQATVSTMTASRHP